MGRWRVSEAEELVAEAENESEDGNVSKAIRLCKKAVKLEPENADIWDALGENLLDDDRNKEGLFMPGNGLPIYSSDKIISEKIDICFTAMSYENEQKVREKNQGFIIDGGQLVPISPNAEQNIYNFFRD